LTNDGGKEIGIILGALLFREALGLWLMHAEGGRLPLGAAQGLHVVLGILALLQFCCGEESQ